MDGRLDGFEPAALSHGSFCRDLCGNKRLVVLLRLPKQLRAEDLDGLKVRTGKAAALAEFVREVVAKDDGGQPEIATERYTMSRIDCGGSAPVALALPTGSASVRIQSCFDEVWAVTLSVDAPRPDGVDLEEEALEAAAKNVDPVPQPVLLKRKRSAV